MAFIKKNTTMILVALIVITLIFFTISTYFYHNNLRQLTQNLENKTIEAQSLSDELNYYVSRLNQTKQDLVTKQEREEDLSGKYLDVKSEKEELQFNQTRLVNDLKDKNEKILDLTGDISGLEDEISSKEAQIRSYQTDIDELEDEVIWWQDQVDDICSEAVNSGNISGC